MTKERVKVTSPQSIKSQREFKEPFEMDKKKTEQLDGKVLEVTREILFLKR